MPAIRSPRLKILKIRVFEAIQVAVRFFIRAVYAFVAHLVLMAVAFLFMLFLDLVGFGGRKAFEITVWEYFWLAMYFPIPFLGYALWLCWLLNLMPKHTEEMFAYPTWAKQKG